MGKGPDTVEEQKDGTIVIRGTGMDWDDVTTAGDMLEVPSGSDVYYSLEEIIITPPTDE